MDTQRQKAYNYYAFISYSRKDEAWARWIQNRLETYRIPPIIRKQNLNIPQKLYPVFRDKTDLTGGKLLETLYEELEASQYLIVICSPNSAGSEWVNKEILHFIQQGREEYIIPLIVDGVPMSEDPETECYPKALMEESVSEILGISISELGREKAFLRVVATLLNLKFDQLVMRDRRRRMKQRAFASVTGLVLLVFALVGLWYNTPHSTYYQDYVYRYEVPVGLYPLTRSERKERSESYRIVTQRGKVIRLERVNSLGRPVRPIIGTSEDDTPVVRFFYEGDQLSRAELYNESGFLVLVKDYSSNLKAVDFQMSDDSSQAFALPADRGDHSLDQDIFSGASRSDITRYLQTYDENGYLTEVRFMRDNRNTPAMDADGNYGFRYERNSSGQISVVSGLDEAGNLHNCRYGYAISSYQYDQNGQCLSCSAFDADWQKARNEFGFFEITLRYDKTGNIISEYHLDEQGNLCNDINGVCQVKLAYNEQSLLYRVWYEDMDGNPTCSNADGIFGYEQLYDKKGNLRSVEYFDNEGLPACNDIGYSRVECNYDEQGHLKEVLYFADEEPAFDRKTGVAGIRYETDEYGRTICETALNTDHQPFICQQGCASAKYQYDPNGNILQYSYYDTEGRTVCGKEGYASAEYKYDTLGNQTGIIYRNEKGNPCIISGGYAEESYTYDSLGNLISEKYYDMDGKPVTTSAGFHECRREYDSHSNLIRAAFYDTEESPVIPSSYNYAAVEYSYDEYSHLTDTIYYEMNGNPVEVDGYYRVSQVYDTRGNLVQETKYPAIEYALDGSSRTAVTLYSYDGRSNLIKTSRFDGDGKPRTDGEHESVTMYTYDAWNRVVTEKILDTDGDPSIKQNNEYNDRNQVTKQILYQFDKETGDETKRGTYHYSYDRFGNITCVKICSSDDKILTCDEYQYNMVNNVTEIAHYDDSHALFLHPDGYARIEYDYDALGNVTQERYYDENNELFCIKASEYNNQGWKLSETWTDAEGQPYASEGNAVRIEYCYDTGGREIERIYYDPKGNMVRSGRMVILDDIEEGSPAALAGIQPGDLLLQYNDWELFHYTNFTAAADALLSTIQQSQENNKILVVCRRQGENADFYEFHLEPGLMGVIISDQMFTVEQAETVREQYELWKSEKQQTEERSQNE